MSDIRTNSSGNLELVGHQIVLVTGEEAIEQHLRIRLKFFLEEWFLDQRIGIPYYRNILIKNPNLDLVRSIFREAILDTPRIVAVSPIELDIDGATRTLNLTFTATMDTGQELEFAPFIIEI